MQDERSAASGDQHVEDAVFAAIRTHFCSDMPARIVAQAALTAARAQVEGENQRLREAINLALHTMEDAPDLNPANYTHDDAMAVNDTSNRAWAILNKALAANEHRKEAP